MICQEESGVLDKILQVRGVRLPVGFWPHPHSTALSTENQAQETGRTHDPDSFISLWEVPVVPGDEE